MKKIVMTMLVVGLMAVAAQAASVHYSFDETASGTWEVSVEVTGTDTAGLSAYGVWVINTPDVSYLEEVLYIGWDGFAPNTLVTGYMDPPREADFNAGNKQNAGGLTGIGMGTDGLGLGVPAHLGTLTTPAGLGVADFGTDSAGLLNAANDGYLGDSEFTVTYEVTPIPEPMTMSLIGLGGLALIRRRR